MENALPASTVFGELISMLWAKARCAVTTASPLSSSGNLGLTGKLRNRKSQRLLADWLRSLRDPQEHGFEMALGFVAIAPGQHTDQRPRLPFRSCRKKFPEHARRLRSVRFD